MLAALASASQEAKTVKPKELQVKVEITTDKKDYVEGEPIKFRVVLVNQGGPAIYIAKSWDDAGGGIAGFFISVKQLRGRPPKLRCGGTADRGVFPDTRSPEQILKEDFVRLPPGDFVGFTDQYRECAVEYAGMYRISAMYSPNDLNTHKVVPLSDEKNSVLTERIYSKPFAFRVHPARKTTNPSPKPGS
ncbi:MAG TPA: hypothetical protein VE377_10870 [Candidatus Dormibacteraeota bacterium]|nr:hypothetical protein [Candidatus Dormibacteraeota bacterium]